MATKVLLNRRIVAAPLAEKSLNKPQRLTIKGGRKRSATTLAMGPPTKKRRQEARTVRFDLSRNRQVSSNLFPLEDSVMAALWYSPQELNQIRRRESNTVKVFKYSNNYLHQMACLLGIACGACEQNDDTPHFFIAQSPARGLERDVLPCVRNRRKEVVQSFLRSQRALQKHPMNFTPEFQETALSQHYNRLARPSVRLAQLIAQGDERALQAN